MSAVDQVSAYGLVSAFDLADAFLRANPKWFDIVHDTGGAGLCDEASAEFMGFCSSLGIVAEALWMSLAEGDAPFCGQSRQLDPHVRYPDHSPALPWTAGQDHCVVWLPDHGVVVDLTARQYGEDFDFPFVWRV